MNKKILIMDIDGTLLEDFKSIYSQIINSLFGKSKAVMRLNLLLYKINDLDIISNSMFIFKSVIFFYSLISFTNFSKNLKQYEKLYVEKSKDEIIRNYNEVVVVLERLGYEVILISHSIYTNNFKKYIPTKIITPRNKMKYIPKNMSNLNIAYMVGNNFFDDIFSSFLLNKKYKKEKINYSSIPIYIGSSKAVTKLLKGRGFTFNNLSELLLFIKKVSRG